MSQIATSDHGVSSGSASLAHHFDTHTQQLAAAKLGMWIFLATELLMFGALFCLYTVLRSNQPELFEWGHHFLDPTLGAINTVILLLSSFTMAWAVRASQLKNRRLLFVLLLLTLAGGFGFMGIKYLEYVHKISHGLVIGSHGDQFQPDPTEIARVFGLPDDQFVVFDGDPAQVQTGSDLFNMSCVACHGPSGDGVPGLGVSLVTGAFVQLQSQDELAAFIEVGRAVDDPQSLTGRLMPAKGGNMLLTEANLQSLAAFVKSLTVGQPSVASQSSDPAMAALQASAVPPENASLFFSIYYLLTGLHGIHVLIGMVLITYLIACTYCNDFATGHITKVDLIGLYWHIVDLIWIFLFPLLYLIH